MEKIIRVENLCKNYNEYEAVKNISFDIKQGEIFGFLGPNGAGKTTTINMLIGMAKITSGSIYYKEKDISSKMKQIQKVIGVVADESNLYPEMSGFDNLSFCGSLYGLKKKEREERAEKLLELFQLKEVKNKKIMAYSKGMKRKLTIAAAIIHKPEILFLDEPTTGIDTASVRQIREIIKELNAKGTTVFLTTHYLEEAERLCDRIAFINKGNIIKLDSVEELLKNTQNKTVLEIIFDNDCTEKENLIKKIENKFQGLIANFKTEKSITITSKNKLDITPLVLFFSHENKFIIEAKLIKPSLEDVFVELTGEEDLNKKRRTN